MLLGNDPRAPGLFGAPSGAPPALQPVPVPGRPAPRVVPDEPSRLEKAQVALSRLFGGEVDPRLSQAQNDAARRQAMLRSGLAMVMASGPSPVRQNLAQVLAQGIMAGQQGGQAARQQMVDASQRGRMQQLASGENSLAQLHQMFAQAVAMGDENAARSIAEVIKAVEAAGVKGQGQRLMEVAGPDGKRLLLDPTTGETVREIEGSQELESKDLGDRIVWYPKGRPDRIVREVRKGRVPGAGGGAYDPNSDPVLLRAIEMRERGLIAPAAGTEDERKAAAFAGFIPEHVQYIDTVLGAPGRVEQAFSDRGLREFNDAEQQQLQLAGNALAEAWLRMTTGAAYNEREFQNAFNLFVPRPGDRQPTLEMKSRNRERLMQMLKTRAGRAAASIPAVETPRPAPSSAPEDPFADLPTQGERPSLWRHVR